MTSTPVSVQSINTADHIRAIIYQKALELFSREGYHAISLRRLASAVGVQPGSLYAHIDNKQCVLFELIEATERQRLERLKASTCSGLAANRLKAYIVMTLCFMQENALGVNLCTYEIRSLDEHYRQQINTLRRQRFSLLEQILLTLHPGLAAHQTLTARLRDCIDAMLERHALDSPTGDATTSSRGSTEDNATAQALGLTIDSLIYACCLQVTAPE